MEQFALEHGGSDIHALLFRFSGHLFEIALVFLERVLMFLRGRRTAHFHDVGRFVPARIRRRTRRGRSAARDGNFEFKLFFRLLHRHFAVGYGGSAHLFASFSCGTGRKSALRGRICRRSAVLSLRARRGVLLRHPRNSPEHPFRRRRSPSGRRRFRKGRRGRRLRALFLRFFFRCGGKRIGNDIFERARIAVQYRGHDGIYAPVDHLIVRKAHVCLVGMNVDVHDLGRHVKEEHIERILPLHEIGGVGVGDRRAHRLIDDISSVDK